MEAKICQRGHSDWDSRGECRICRNAAARRRYSDPSSKRRVYMREYHAKRYADPNIRKTLIGRTLKHYRENREFWLDKKQRRKLTKDGNDYRRMIAADPCSYCGGPATETDHIEPVASGGAGEWDNIAKVCRTCNRLKRDHGLLVWLARTRLESICSVTLMERSLNGA